MGVTLVVRGEDHLTNTPRQILLLQALGLPRPEYAHIALVVDADGAPLSKRTGSRSVQELREAGFLPPAINNYLARLGHTYDANALMSLYVLSENFELSRLGRAPARYDEAQLRHWQHEAVLHLPLAELGAWLGPALAALVPPDRRDEFIETVRGNVTFPADALHWARTAFTDSFTISHAAHAVIVAAGTGFFDDARRALEKHGTDFKAATTMLKQTTGLGGKALFQPLRAALTGEIDGPEMARLLPLIGLDRAHRRIAQVLSEIAT
jgi:glutamyl-tRNA synthetase